MLFFDFLKVFVKMNLNYMDDIFSYKKSDNTTTNCGSEKLTADDNVGEDDLYAILGCHPEATVSLTIDNFKNATIYYIFNR